MPFFAGVWKKMGSSCISIVFIVGFVHLWKQEKCM